MKQLGSKKITKEIKTLELHPSISNIVLKATYENSKLNDAQLELKKQPFPGHKVWPQVVTPEFWEMIKTINPWWEVKGKFGLSKETVREAKDIINEDTIDPKNIILSYGGGHLIFDVDAKIIPTPYAMDYIGTPNENTKVDLEAWLEDLKKNPMVVNADELHIVEVPYYNNESGRKKYIKGKTMPWIVVLPDQETMTKLFELGMEKDKAFFSVRMKDILFGDWLTYAQDQARGTKNAAPIDPLNVRKFLKKHNEIEY